MTRSKQHSHYQHSCVMCDPGKREPGVPKPSDRRRMQDDGNAGDYSPEERRADPDTCTRECCSGAERGRVLICKVCGEPCPGSGQAGTSATAAIVAWLRAEADRDEALASPIYEGTSFAVALRAAAESVERGEWRG